MPITWALVAAQAAMASRRHWQLLTPHDRERIREIVVKSKGQPWNLSAHERKELTRLVRKMRLGHLTRDIAGIATGARKGGRR
jgi:TRAP-type C4-dicarboxylate transport system substrate-binding protein